MIADYYMLLDLPDGSSVEEIKRAYRKKAREYHPDLNHTVIAMDKFIQVTEAYEFLMTHYESRNVNDEAFNTVMEDWNLHQRDMARKRAKVYARASFIQFKHTRFYKTTRLLDGTTIVFSLAIAVCVIIFSIYGYLWRLHHPYHGGEKPSVILFIVFLLLGGVFLAVSLSFLKTYYLSSKWYRIQHNEKD